MSGLHGIVTVKEISLVNKFKEVLVLDNLNNVFVGQLNNININNQIIQFKLYGTTTQRDIITTLELNIDPNQKKGIMGNVDKNWITKYITGALNNKLFPKAIGYSNRTINLIALQELVRRGLVDQIYSNLNQIPEKKEREQILKNILEIMSESYDSCYIIKNGLIIENLGTLCAILNKKRINDFGDEKLKETLELINNFKDQQEHNGAVSEE